MLDKLEEQVMEALESMDAERLRELVRSLLPYVASWAQGYVFGLILEQATEDGSGWRPSAPSETEVARVLEYMDQACQVHEAEPWEVDEALLTADRAFLARQYETARRVYEAVLAPLSDGEISCGEEEIVEEVLSVDLSKSAARYAVAAYMATEMGDRPKALFEALSLVRYLAWFVEPLRAMEEEAVEPLPDLEAFLPRWFEFLDAEARRYEGTWERPAELWRREAAWRMRGIEGLADLARSTGSYFDYRAWCDKLVETRDWAAVLAACEEAAEALEGSNGDVALFLDTAARAAFVLGRRDLPAYLERAWRAQPTLRRLRRWLGSAADRRTMGKLVAKALEACPEAQHCQRAFLLVLSGRLDEAAALLTQAPGAAWAGAEPPGDLLFPVFCRLLGRAPESLGLGPPSCGREDWGNRWTHRKEDTDTRIPVPPVREILDRAGVQLARRSHQRNVLLQALRRAAEDKLELVTQAKDRQSYGHAAALAVAVVALEGTPAARQWLEALRRRYRRFRALQREFEAREHLLR